VYPVSQAGTPFFKTKIMESKTTFKYLWDFTSWTESELQIFIKTDKLSDRKTLDKNGSSACDILEKRESLKSK
jgi:hypothetical protein